MITRSGASKGCPVCGATIPMAHSGCPQHRRELDRALRTRRIAPGFPRRHPATVAARERLDQLLTPPSQT
jgi:hypothetical protein